MLMLQNAMLNKKGMTLVEVLIALVILLLVFLAVMQTALVGIDSNVINVLRNEAISIAEIKMNEARNIPFDSLAAGTTSEQVVRNFRNITSFTYNVTRTVTDFRGGEDKQVNITVTWEWKEKTVGNGNPYTHSISTLLRRQ